MILKHICKNGKELIICARNEAEGVLADDRLRIESVLLSAWSIESVSSSLWKNIVERVVTVECENVLCCGTYGENLHDFIDNIWIDCAEENDKDFVLITTWHDQENAEDVVDYLVHTIPLTNSGNNTSVMVLDLENGGDQELKERALLA